VLVTFADPAADPAALRQSPLAAGVSRLGFGAYRVDLAAGATVAAAAPAFARLPGVTAAAPDYRVAATALPNDPGFTAQRGLRNTGQWGGRAGADLNAAAAWTSPPGPAGRSSR
jgi:hypothetical protein